jgi:hypothetical protein
MSGEWYVFDPQPMPEFGPGPKLYVNTDGKPFATEDEAWEFANAMHDEDGAGNAVVLQATRA